MCHTGVTVSVACVWRQVWRIRHIDITDVRSYLTPSSGPGWRGITDTQVLSQPLSQSRLPASSHYAQSSVGVALYIKLYRRYAARVHGAPIFSHSHKLKRQGGERARDT